MPFHCDHSRRLLGFARKMRGEPTEAERKFWFMLRGRRLTGFKFRRQVPAAGYVLDFYCMKGKLVVELDGDQHADPGQLEYDLRRTAKLNRLGMRVLRFTDYEFLKDANAVIETIYRELMIDQA